MLILLFYIKNTELLAYDYTSGSQPIWSTYHYLIEVLKTQKPKLIALESYIVAASRTNVVDYQIVAATYALKMVGK